MRLASFVFAIVVLQGCAGVNVQRGKDLSSAGIAYSDAASAVVDVAIDSMIDVDSVTMVRVAPRQPVTDPEARAKRKQLLDGSNNQLAESVTAFTLVKHNIAAVKAYFVALQALANGSQAEATGQAVKSLADNINHINETLEKKPLLTADQAKAVSGIASLVAAEVHGQKVAEGMREGAGPVLRALFLQQAYLRTARDEIIRGLEASSTIAFVDRVETPMLSGQFPSSWVEDRRSYVKVLALGRSTRELDTADAAAKQMELAWKRVLSGEYSTAEINAMLKETQELLDAAIALKAANKAADRARDKTE